MTEHEFCERMCGRKRRYKKVRYAWRAARRIQAQTGGTNTGPWPYHCPICDGYHVGNDKFARQGGV